MPRHIGQATFASARDAKEFLITQIVDEARREGVPLTDVERGMLYFSETCSAPHNIISIADRFEREYDEEQYERKIASLICSARRRLRREHADQAQAWSSAVRILRREDHYLSVLISEARDPRAWWVDRLKLLGTALLVLAVGLPLMFLALRSNVHLPRADVWVPMIWVAGIGAAGGYWILRVAVGSERADAAIERITAFLFRTKQRS